MTKRKRISTKEFLSFLSFVFFILSSISWFELCSILIVNIRFCFVFVWQKFISHSHVCLFENRSESKSEDLVFMSYIGICWCNCSPWEKLMFIYLWAYFDDCGNVLRMNFRKRICFSPGWSVSFTWRATEQLRTKQLCDCYFFGKCWEQGRKRIKKVSRIFYVQQLFRLKELSKSMVNIAESLCDRVSVRKRIAVKTAFSSILRSSFLILITQEQEGYVNSAEKPD